MPSVKLTRTWLHNGRHYGPGDIEIDDAETAAMLTEHERRVVVAGDTQPRAVDPANAQHPVDDQTRPDTDTQTPRQQPRTSRRPGDDKAGA